MACGDRLGYIGGSILKLLTGPNHHARPDQCGHEGRHQGPRRAAHHDGRPELEAQEREEIEIIKEFLPKPLTEAEIDAAIKAAIAETGAEGLRDMGKVVGVLKAKYPGQIDFGQASRQVKAQLGA